MDQENELMSIAKRWDEAIVSNQVEAIGRFMSDDWVIVGTDAGITSKDSFLKLIESGDLLHSRMDSDESRIKIYENTGIVTSRGTSAGNYKGNSFALYEWSTSVFIKTQTG